MFTWKTQDANETFNGLIWERWSRIWHCGLQKLEFGFYDAVASFKYGKKASSGIFVI